MEKPQVTEGYGHDFTNFDALTAPLLVKAEEKFGKHSYRNWYPFKSPKGDWMAFHMVSYSDIRIVNLDSMEIVVDGEFYAHIVKGADGKNDWRHKDTVYNSHTNTSVYVPSYYIDTYDKGKDPEGNSCGVGHYAVNDREFDDDESTLGNMKSVPIAFTAWTIWAADYEFYVDMLDLSEVDEGRVSLLSPGEKFQGACIPISARHVRNWVKPEVDYWLGFGGHPDAAHATFDVQLLTEHHLGRVELGGEKAGQMHDIYDDEREPYPRAKTPWVAMKERMDEGAAKRAAAKVAAE